MSDANEPVQSESNKDINGVTKPKLQSESASQMNGANPHRMTEPSLHSTSKSNLSDLNTLAQYKNRRKRVQQDVDLLHNRIKMLRLEEERAMKKIQETRKKANQIMELKKQNDMKYEQKLKQKERQHKRLNMKKGKRYEEAKQRRIDIEERKNAIRNERRNVAQSLRMRRKQNERRKFEYLQDLRMKNMAKKELIKTQERQAYVKLQNFKQRQLDSTKQQNQDLVINEKDLIKQRELEAQKLERLEAELLQNLQQTQNMEREAFNQLENAMIDASKPKRQRVNKSRLSQRTNKRGSKKSSL